jgi:sortase A
MRRPPALSLVAVILIVAATSLFTYPSTASWLQAREDRAVLSAYLDTVGSIPDGQRGEQLNAARAWNAGESAADPATLLGDTQSPIAALTIPRTGQTLPVYYGDSDDTLLKGVGVVPGTALPVGGDGTRSVISGHTGLASAPMFTHLDDMEAGDTFTIAVLGDILTYRVRDIRVVGPDDTESIRPEPGSDLVTLLTCTPPPLNTHRLLVTGERIPTPDTQTVGDALPTPGFPYWAVADGAGLSLAAAYLALTARRTAAA